MVTISDFLEELEQEAQTTRRVLERVPDEMLRWKPHEKSRTLGQLAMHVATLPGAIAELAMQSEFDVRTRVPRPDATSTKDLIDTLDQSITHAKDSLSAMTDAMLHAPWRMMNGEKEIFQIPRGVFIRSVLLNHWYHHRGQLSVYLRLTGSIVPSIYGDSADENPFA